MSTIALSLEKLGAVKADVARSDAKVGAGAKLIEKVKEKAISAYEWAKDKAINTAPYVLTAAAIAGLVVGAIGAGDAPHQYASHELIEAWKASAEYLMAKAGFSGGAAAAIAAVAAAVKKYDYNENKNNAQDKPKDKEVNKNEVNEFIKAAQQVHS